MSCKMNSMVLVYEKTGIQVSSGKDKTVYLPTLRKIWELLSEECDAFPVFEGFVNHVMSLEGVYLINFLDWALVEISIPDPDDADCDLDINTNLLARSIRFGGDILK